MLLHAPGMLSGIRTGRVGVITGAALGISTAASKFGASSLNNNGTGANYLQETPITGFAFGTGDFTIEFWYNPLSQSTQQGMVGFRPQTSNGAYPSLLVNYPTALRQVTYYTNNATKIQTASNVLTNGTWTAIALVRSSSVTTIYINGVASGTPFTDTTNYLASRLIIAADDYNATGSTNTPLNGYMDELRISNIARYTTTYTPATQPFIDDANTLLLLHFDQANGSKNIVDDNS